MPHNSHKDPETTISIILPLSPAMIKDIASDFFYNPEPTKLPYLNARKQMLGMDAILLWVIPQLIGTALPLAAP